MNCYYTTEYQQNARKFLQIGQGICMWRLDINSGVQYNCTGILCVTYASICVLWMTEAIVVMGGHHLYDAAEWSWRILAQADRLRFLSLSLK